MRTCHSSTDWEATPLLNSNWLYQRLTVRYIFAAAQGPWSIQWPQWSETPDPSCHPPTTLLCLIVINSLHRYLYYCCQRMRLTLSITLLTLGFALIHAASLVSDHACTGIVLTVHPSHHHMYIALIDSHWMRRGSWSRGQRQVSLHQTVLWISIPQWNSPVGLMIFSFVFL